MKKLLTLLLTLVMAVCLINLNNNHTKADGENETTTYEYKYDGSNWAWTQDPGANITEGNKIKLTNNSTTDDVTLHLIDGSTETIAKSGGIKEISVVYNVTKADIDTSTANNITILDGVKCNGLKYDGDTSGDKTGWLESDGGTPETLAPITSERLTQLGILMDGNTATLSKSLYNNSGESPTINSTTTALNITLGENITLMNKSGSVIKYGVDTTINGNNKKLVLSAKGGYGITYDGGAGSIGLTLNNTKIMCMAYGSGSSAASIKNLTLNGNCEIRVSCLTGGYALYTDELSQTIKDNYVILGSAISNPASDDDLVVATRDTDSKYKVPGDTDALVNAMYILFKHKQTPTPTPEPQPKDESCEKVIGPTWHWNNTKGICEDYGVVGTFTR